MNYGYLLLGIALLVLAVGDLVWTTLWVDGGAGPMSSRLSSRTWSGLRRVAGDHPRVLSLAGPIILVLTLIAWIGLLWAGWTFVFAAGDGAIVDTRNTESVSWTGRLYFVAYAMFTMGNGDFTPADGGWQIATSLTTASGMLFVTLGVSYVLSVLGAVVDKRSFAGTVTGLGSRSEAFARNGWEDDRFAGIDLPIDSLASDLSRLSEQHRAYPILHYYHSEREATSSAVAVAVFDETITILRHGVPEDQRPNRAILETAGSSTDHYLQTLASAFIAPADETPPPPDLDRLREADVPTVADAEFEAALDELTDRRRRLLGMVHSDARDWPPVEEEEGEEGE